MVQFDDLADNAQRLLFAKLALAIVSENCTNIVDLAQKRKLDVETVWREVCRTAGQPLCTIPRTVRGFRID